MEPEIEALNLNNSAPSEEAEQEIKNLILKNLQELDSLDFEIVNLENRLQELRTKRDTTQRTIHRYQSILSPLRRMSPEILAEIFYRCLPTHRNPLIAPTECPLLLMQVCSFWRAVAMSGPRLWERIYITFSESIRDYRRHFSTQHANKILRRRLKAVRRWVARSGTRPLSISISFTNGLSYFSTLHQGDHLVVWEFFRYIASLSPRFKDLELKMPLSTYRILETMIDAPGMTELTSLRAALPKLPYEEDSDEVISNPILLLKAPNLNNIAISSSVLKMMNSLQKCTWSKVTDLSIHEGLKPTQLLFLLQYSPNLVHFKATLCREDDIFVTDVQDFEPVSLPFLHTFSIKDKSPWPSLEENRGLYRRIDAPGITWMEYSGTLGSTLHGTETDYSIVALLERLPALKKLTIDCDFLDHQMYWTSFLRRMFRAVPSVTHLFFGCEERSPAGSLMRYPPDYTSPSWKGPGGALVHLPIHDLIGIQHQNSTNLGDGSNNDPPLLPNLSLVEILSCVHHIVDSDLIKFVISRINPALFPPLSSPLSGSGIARLKHVGIVFYRERTLDIAAKIREYADSVGASMIDLFLDYPEPTEPEMSYLSPEYGLDTFNGRSWDYKDAEEFEVDQASN